jgi:hypothetical protein
MSIRPNPLSAKDQQLEKIVAFASTNIPPKRAKDTSLVFDNCANLLFKPNLAPAQIFQAGAFGGTYYRPIKSTVCPHMKFDEQIWQEYPDSWFKDLEPSTHIASPIYRKTVNKYKVKCGASLEEWERSGWIKPQDPYGWMQWYMRFFLGRRSPDDNRQILRWLNCTGENGRWKNRLCKLIFERSGNINDFNISPVIRQVLLHWGYELTKQDYLAWCHKFNM